MGVVLKGFEREFERLVLAAKGGEGGLIFRPFACRMKGGIYRGAKK